MSIFEGVLAFAAGDALGVPWEGCAPAEIDLERLADLPRRGDWPPGATSDDTAQLLLVARYLVDSGGRPEPSGLVARLAEALPTMRGAGPTTRAAVEHWHRSGRPPTIADLPGGGATNGAAMRILPAGWVLPVAAAGGRRGLVAAIATATHPAPVALGAAHVVAAMGAWAVEGVTVEAVIEAALGELDWLHGHDQAAEHELHAVREAVAGSWHPPSGGVGLDAAETVAAVMHVLRRHHGLAAALPYAVSLGGDTDTVAALVGGILGSRGGGEVAALPWLDRVAFEERDVLARLAGSLLDHRRAWHGR